MTRDHQYKPGWHFTPFLLILAASLATALLSLHPLAVTLESKTIDMRIRFRNPDKDFARDIKVVSLDEEFMKSCPYRSPVPRDALAKLIEILSDAGARLLALDILLRDASTAEADEKLVAAMKKSGRVVIASQLRYMDGQPRLDLPLDVFRAAARASGLAQFPADPIDRKVRELQISYQAGARVLTLPAVLFELAKDGIRIERNEKPGRALRFDGNERCLINYQGPPFSPDRDFNSIAVIPASAVMTGQLPSEWFKDKIVLIGAGYEDNLDAYQTPFSSARFKHVLTPGVEIHANALATLLGGRTIHTPAPWVVFLFAFLASMAVLLIDRSSNSIVSGITLVPLLLGYAAGALVYFNRSSYAIPVVPVVTSSVLGYACLAAYRSLTEGRQKRWIHDAFKMYISPEFVSILVKNPEKLNLGGESKELTILFSDLEGFTTLSETRSPAELVRILNEYLDGMTRILFEHGGTLDKYEGDAVIAFWGAPVPVPDHAIRAARATLAMNACSEQLSRSFQQSGGPRVRTRIGLNTGKALVGNIGSQQRFNYTMIGDEVNLASRLEGANKVYGTTVIVSESTQNMLAGQFLTRELDLIRVKGRAAPVHIFELIADIRSPVPEAVTASLAAFGEGLAQYRRRHWQAAITAFERCGDDLAARTFVDRCRQYEKNPPPEDWDGVFVMTTK